MSNIWPRTFLPLQKSLYALCVEHFCGSIKWIKLIGIYIYVLLPIMGTYTDYHYKQYNLQDADGQKRSSFPMIPGQVECRMLRHRPLHQDSGHHDSTGEPDINTGH